MSKNTDDAFKPPRPSMVSRSRSEGAAPVTTAPPALQRQASAPARLAASLVELDKHVRSLASLSSCAALIAVAQQHSSSGSEMAWWREENVDVVDARRPFMKKATRGHSRNKHSAASGTQKFAGGPTSVRTRRAAPAYRHRVKIGPQTLHIAVADGPVRCHRFEQREWANATRFREGRAGIHATARDGGLGVALAPPASAAAVPEQPRHILPRPGTLPCDGDLDLSGLLAALPDDVLRFIALHHGTARRSQEAAELAEQREEEMQRERYPRPRRRLGAREGRSDRLQQERVNRAYTTQSLRARERGYDCRRNNAALDS